MGHAGATEPHAIARRCVQNIPAQPLSFGSCSLQAASTLCKKPTGHCQKCVHRRQTGICELACGLLEDSAWYRHSLSQHAFSAEILHTGPAMSVLRLSFFSIIGD
uniref:Uncharacterized protein n=1 Tax=Trichogramma kaykai TaxID=54128 RepID=A0ABD2WS12_9HYME